MTIELAPARDTTDMMVDLETLGTKPFCPILTIGACCVRMDNELAPTVEDVFYQPIELQSCLDAGLRVDGATLEWWMQQEPTAQVDAFFDPRRVKLPLALDAFTDFWNSRPMRMWANPALFDFGILRAAYQACGKDVPWDHTFERCYRTIKKLPAALPIELTRTGTHHNALDDAISQALHLRLINTRLQLQL